MPKFCGMCGSPLSGDGSCPSCGTSPNMPGKGGKNLDMNKENQSGDFTSMNTMYASREPVNIDSSMPFVNNMGDSPVHYEGSQPVPNPPSVPNDSPNTAPPPISSPVASPSGKGKKQRKPKSRGKVKKSAIIAISSVLVLGIMTSGVTVLSCNRTLNIPGISPFIRSVAYENYYGSYKNNYIVTGDKITSRLINEPADALKVAQEFTETLNFEYFDGEYTFLDDYELDGLTYYRFRQNYNAFPVYGRIMTIVADADGNSCGVSTNVIDIPKNINLSIPDFDKDEVLDTLESLNDSGVEVSVGAYTRSIYSLDYTEEPILVYQVMAVVNNINYMLFIEPEEGEVINGYCLDSTMQLTGDGKNMIDNPQTFNGTAQGPNRVMIDEERDISVFNADKGSSSIEVEYLDSDLKSYFNRRFDIGDVDDVEGESVCVIYDEDGNYYEYNYDTGKFEKDDISIDLSKLKQQGYSVFNRASGKAIRPVQSSNDIIKDELAVRLMVNAAKTYDFFNMTLDRKGYDGKGGKLLAVCNDYLGGDSDNAFSAGDNNGFTMIVFGYDNPIDVDDVAHEYTHSVEQSISGLLYQNESGAVMEGISEVFGELVEDGTDGSLDELTQNLDNSCDWQNNGKYFSNPLITEAPYLYGGLGYTEKMSEEDWKDSNLGLLEDFGGVHDNSTVVSHLGYLMANEGDDDEVLETKQLLNLWYRTMFLLVPDSSFSMFRECMELQADRMLDSGELTDVQREYVSSCFEAVNIPTLYYDNSLEIKVIDDSGSQSYTVKIEGSRFAYIGKKTAKEITLDSSKESDDGSFVYSDFIDLEDGRYTIKITNDDNKMNSIKREIVINSGETDNNKNSVMRSVEYSFVQPSAMPMPSMDASAMDSAAMGDISAADTDLAALESEK